MPWVKIDDMFPHHPKVAETGPLGLALYVAGLCYSSRYLTDGFLPRSVIPMLLDFDGIQTKVTDPPASTEFIDDANPMDIAKTLVQVGLWHEVKGGYSIHDYLEYQPSSEEVKRQREENARRQKEWRERRKRNRGSNGVRNGVTNGPVTPTPYPYPVNKDTSEDAGASRTTNRKKISYEEQHIELARELNEHIQNNNPRAKPATDRQLEDWANEVRLMEERDNLEFREIRAVLRWSQNNTFWRKNIKSMGTLRDKYARLWEEMQDEGRQSKSSQEPTPLRPKYYDNDLSQRRAPF